MKLGKISFVAALAISTSLSANTSDKVTNSMKVDAQVKLWYQTMDHEGLSNGKPDKGLFVRDANQPNEWGNLEAQISVSGAANDHIKYKVTAMTVTTMGTDGVYTSGQTARPGQFGASNGYDAQPFWVHEVYLDYALSSSTNIKGGRLELNTPLIYTEKWNATANSFEALTVTNTDLDNTLLTAGWVAKGNGATDSLIYAPQVFGAEAKYVDFMAFKDINGNKIANGGMVVLGATNNSFKTIPLEAWGYLASNVAQAYWLQASPSFKDVGPLDKVGVQLIGAGVGADGATENYLKSDPESNGNNKAKMTHALATKVALNTGMFNAYAAYSTIGEGNLPVANMGTNFKKTKLPTASIFNDGMVAAQPDTTSWKVGVGAKFDGIGTLAVSYGSYDVGRNAGYQNTNKNVGGPASMGYIAQNFLQRDMDVNEFDVVFKTKVKDVNLAAMYIKVNETYVPILGNSAANGGSTLNYGTYGNDIVRLVATLKF